jgi:hypothetical protein
MHIHNAVLIFIFVNSVSLLMKPDAAGARMEQRGNVPASWKGV